jgi:hypothetical protein
MTMISAQGQLSRGKRGWVMAACTCIGGSTAVALALVAGLGLSGGARADEAYAKHQMKAMSDYMAQQSAVSFGFDTDLEIVTPDHQKLTLANSGTVSLSRPDKIRAKRDGGFSNVEMIFDGKMLTLVHKDATSTPRLMCRGRWTISLMSCGISSTSPFLAPICLWRRSMTS